MEQSTSPAGLSSPGFSSIISTSEGSVVVVVGFFVVGFLVDVGLWVEVNSTSFSQGQLPSSSGVGLTTGLEGLTGAGFGSSYSGVGVVVVVVVLGFGLGLVGFGLGFCVVGFLVGFTPLADGVLGGLAHSGCHGKRL